LVIEHLPFITVVPHEPPHHQPRGPICIGAVLEKESIVGETSEVFFPMGLADYRAAVKVDGYNPAPVNPAEVMIDWLEDCLATRELQLPHTLTPIGPA
jgi:hypothetical protein